MNQCEMAVGDHDAATMQFCQAHGITYESYGALRAVDLTDKTLAAAAKAHGVTTAQVALRWVTQQGCPVAVSPGLHEDYAVQDLGLGGFKLTSAEKTAISAIKKVQGAPDSAERRAAAAAKTEPDVNAPLMPPPPMPPPPPAGAPPLRPALNFSIVVTADDAIESCYRNPVLIQTRTGALLCFIEERSRGQGWKPGSGSHACPDNYGVGAAARGGHNLGYFRSTDLGKPAVLFALQLPWH